MSGVKRMLVRLYRWWRPLCEEDGCDRPSIRWAPTCGAHFSQQMEAAGREIAHQRFERDVEVHLEALRRHDAETSGAVGSGS